MDPPASRRHEARCRMVRLLQPTIESFNVQRGLFESLDVCFARALVFCVGTDRGEYGALRSIGDGSANVQVVEFGVMHGFSFVGLR